MATPDPAASRGHLPPFAGPTGTPPDRPWFAPGVQRAASLTLHEHVRARLAECLRAGYRCDAHALADALIEAVCEHVVSRAGEPDAVDARLALAIAACSPGLAPVARRALTDAPAMTYHEVAAAAENARAQAHAAEAEAHDWMALEHVRQGGASNLKHAEGYRRHAAHYRLMAANAQRRARDYEDMARAERSAAAAIDEHGHQELPAGAAS